MQRGVVGAHFDPFLVQHGVDEIVFGSAELLGIDLYRIQMEHVFAPWAQSRQGNPRHVTQPLRKIGGVVNTAVVQRIQFLQLHNTHGSLDISQAEIVAAIVEVLPPEPVPHGEA